MQWLCTVLKKARNMTFATDGFCSPAMARFRSSVRGVPEYEAWLRFAENLNRLGLDMLKGHEVPTTDNQRLLISVLFVRAHKSFQSAIILAETGLLGDARAVVRRAVEGAIALNALANDAGFVDLLIKAHYYNQRKIARLMLGNTDYRAALSAQKIAKLEATVSEIDSMEAAGSELRDIIWADVAAKHCRDLYELLYRLFSSDGTHTTINAIHREVIYDAAGRITGLKVGPDTAGMVETLNAACLTLLWAADPFARAFNQSGIRVQIQEQIRRFAQLPQDEPVNAQVVANFG
jgi:hypothetical protein